MFCVCPLSLCWLHVRWRGNNDLTERWCKKVCKNCKKSTEWVQYNEKSKRYRSLHDTCESVESLEYLTDETKDIIINVYALCVCAIDAPMLSNCHCIALTSYRKIPDNDFLCEEHLLNGFVCQSVRHTFYKFVNM